MAANQSGHSLGLYRSLTGLKVPNGAVLRVDPTRPDQEPDLLFVPDAG
jgi:hypothetical protein